MSELILIQRIQRMYNAFFRNVHKVKADLVYAFNVYVKTFPRALKFLVAQRKFFSCIPPTAENILISQYNVLFLLLCEHSSYTLQSFHI